MLKTTFISLAAFGAMAFGATAASAACPTFYSFQNGQEADATQVMSDFDYILECPNFNGVVTANNDLQIVGQPNWDGLITKNWTGGWPFTTLGPGPTMGIAFGNLNTSSDFIFYTGPVATASGQTGAPTEVFRITQGGDVGIGTSSPINLLDLGSGFTSDNSFQAVFWGGTNGIGFNYAGNAVIQGRSGSGGGQNSTLLINPYGGVVGINTTSPPTSYNLYVNGTAAGTSGFANLSDARLKKDILPLDDGLRLVERLRPVTFYWRPPNQRTVGRNLNLPSGKQQVGFIAQEVEKVVPQAVVPPADVAKEPYTLRENDLVPVLVAAIKEQQAEIGRQQAQIDRQQAEIDALRVAASAQRNGVR